MATTTTTATTATTSYENHPAWRKQMACLPEALHLSTPEAMPSESTWAYKGHAVHVDSCGDPATSPVTLILVHGTCLGGVQGRNEFGSFYKTAEVPEHSFLLDACITQGRNVREISLPRLHTSPL